MMNYTIDWMFLEISGIENAGDLFKVKRLPGRFLDYDRDVWIVPIRPGLCDAIRDILGAETLAELLRGNEKYFTELIEPPAPGSVNIWAVPAGVAVELATLHHLYTFHHGNREEYAVIHAPYKIGE